MPWDGPWVCHTGRGSSDIDGNAIRQQWAGHGGLPRTLWHQPTCPERLRDGVEVSIAIHRPLSECADVRVLRVACRAIRQFYRERTLSRTKARSSLQEVQEHENQNEEANENDDEDRETPDKLDEQDHAMEGGDASSARHSSDVELKPRRETHRNTRKRVREKTIDGEVTKTTCHTCPTS